MQQRHVRATRISLRSTHGAKLRTGRVGAKSLILLFGVAYADVMTRLLQYNTKCFIPCNMRVNERKAIFNNDHDSQEWVKR